MLLDFFSKNIPSLFFGLFVVEILFFFLSKNAYRKQKAIGWMYITVFLFISFVFEIGKYLFVLVIVGLSFYEFLLLLQKDSIGVKIGYLIPFCLVLLGLILYYLNVPNEFLFFFVCVSLSDIVAYSVGSIWPWKKGFTSISPNKSLSGVVAQAIFLGILTAIILQDSLKNPIGILSISLLVGSLGPAGDLLESYFKRCAGVKDSADYIPGHGGVLDRLDSSFLGSGVLLLAHFFR